MNKTKIASEFLNTYDNLMTSEVGGEAFVALGRVTD